MRRRIKSRSFAALRTTRRAAFAATTLLVAVGCMEKDTTQKMAQAFQPRASHPDEVPKVLNTDLPFRYPAALYARRVQGNVTLRLYVDTTGQVRADSTRIEESSGYPSLDSAARRTIA